MNWLIKNENKYSPYSSRYSDMKPTETMPQSKLDELVQQDIYNQAYFRTGPKHMARMPIIAEYIKVERKDEIDKAQEIFDSCVHSGFIDPDHDPNFFVITAPGRKFAGSFLWFFPGLYFFKHLFEELGIVINPLFAVITFLVGKYWENIILFINELITWIATKIHF